MRRGILLVSLAAGACAASTDVVPVGDGVYTVANHGFMGWSSGPAQKAAALQKATEYCNGMGKELQTISAGDSGPGGFGETASAQVRFRCAGSGTANPR